MGFNFVLFALGLSSVLREKKNTLIMSLSFHLKGSGGQLGWRQDNGNRSNQESKFDFLTSHLCLVKIDKGQQKRKIVLPTDNQIYPLPANHFSPSAGTTLVASPKKVSEGGGAEWVQSALI